MTQKEVKAALGKRVRLRDGTEGRFTAYILRVQDGKVLHQAELQDLNAWHSVRICRLEDVEIANE